MIPPFLLPEDYHPNAIIAGGYAACPAMANDIDVWVTAVIDLRAARDVIRHHLHDRAIVKRPGRGHIRSYVFEDDQRTESSNFEGYTMDVNIVKVAKVEIWGARLPYHILVTDANVDELLSAFDVSTHQVALTPLGVVTGESWTPINEPPAKLKNTPTTDARMEKIRSRYARS